MTTVFDPDGFPSESPQKYPLNEIEVGWWFVVPFDDFSDLVVNRVRAAASKMNRKQTAKRFVTETHHNHVVVRCVKPVRRKRRNLKARSKPNPAQRTTATKTASGVTGVTKDRRAGRWVAYIGIEGKMKYLGCFKELDDAVEARRKAELEHGYRAGDAANVACPE